VTLSGTDYYIYRYEASRVDATSTDQGLAETRACSRRPTAAGLRPWTLVNLAQARGACQAAGMRLCRVDRPAPCSSTTPTYDEWGFACSAGAICPDSSARGYPYGCGYDPSACNGVDRATGDVVATGTLAMCISPDLDSSSPGDQTVNDMSGNVSEWTEDCRSTLSDGSGRQAYTLRGGSFTSVPGALRCDFMSLVVAENFSFNDTGFRCCSSCAPGLADCGGRCVSLASDAQNCGTCGHPCPSGQSCQNGFCR
jgi:formylglycine-generating enzyme required for sulfatase activity